MSIHPDCQKKVMALGEGERFNRGLLDMFNAIANDADQQHLPSGTLVIPYYDKDSNLQPGDWAAELHLVVRKVESIDNVETHPDAEEDDEPEEG